MEGGRFRQGVYPTVSFPRTLTSAQEGGEIDCAGTGGRRKYLQRVVSSGGGGWKLNLPRMETSRNWHKGHCLADVRNKFG